MEGKSGKTVENQDKPIRVDFKCSTEEFADELMSSNKFTTMETRNKRQNKIVLECGDAKIKAYMKNDASDIPVKEILMGHFTVGTQPQSGDIGNKISTVHFEIQREVIVKPEKSTVNSRVDASFSTSDNPNSAGMNRGLTEDGDNNMMSGSSTPGSSGSGTSKSFEILSGDRDA